MPRMNAKIRRTAAIACLDMASPETDAWPSYAESPGAHGGIAMVTTNLGAAGAGEAQRFVRRGHQGFRLVDGLLVFGLRVAVGDDAAAGLHIHGAVPIAG